MNDWIVGDAAALLRVVFCGTLFYLITIVASKLAGLRSFTTSSSFDFLITLAMGALLATTMISQQATILQGTLGISTLYLLQTAVATARRHWKVVQKLVDNQPMLLMEHGRFHEANLVRARITRDEVRAKLRSAGVRTYDEVRAVVLESTGDFSVIKQADGDAFDADLLRGVRC